MSFKRPTAPGEGAAGADDSRAGMLSNHNFSTSVPSRQTPSDFAKIVPGTIAYDAIVEHLVKNGQTRRVALVGGVVFGAIFRFSRLDPSGLCRHGQEIVAENARCAVRTLQYYIKILIGCGLIFDNDAGKRGGPHRYSVTDEALVIIDGDAESYAETADKSAEVAQKNAEVAQLEVHEEDDELINTIKILEDELIKKGVNLQDFTDNFGHMALGQLKYLTGCVEKYGVERINQGVEATTIEQPAKPPKYLFKVIKNGLFEDKPIKGQRKTGSAASDPPEAAQKIGRSDLLPPEPEDEPTPDAWALVLSELKNQLTAQQLMYLQGSVADLDGGRLIVTVVDDNAKFQLSRAGVLRNITGVAKSYYGDLQSVEFYLVELKGIAV